MLPKNRITPHPGEMLLEEFLKPLNVSQRSFAIAIGVDPHVISEIVHERRNLSPLMCLKFAKALNMSAEFWAGLQSDYDITKARADKATKEALRDIKPVAKAG